MRSLLFVPGDRPERFDKAVASRADVVIFDLEDSVLPEERPRARIEVARYVESAQRRCAFWIRINPVQTSDALADLLAVMRAKPDGIMLPKPRGIADLVRLNHWLEALEQQVGLARGTVEMTPIVTENARSVLCMREYVDLPSRVKALTWGAEDLAAELGAENRTALGAYEPPFELARSLCLLAAAAAEITAIDTIDPEIDDTASVERRARESRRLGFTAKMAIHPKQITSIHAAFAPSESEISWAKRVDLAFRGAGAAGVVKLDGRMLDRPHLRQAQRILHAAAKA